MAHDVVVRFVPKTRSAAPRVDCSFEAICTAPQEFRPDPQRTRSALNWLAGRAAVTPTQGSRLEVSLDRRDFTQLFGAGLQPGHFSDQDERRDTWCDDFDVPDKPMTIPNELQDTIDFAYVPRPIEFYAPTFRPPTEALEYLSLDDVAAALNAARAHRQKRTGGGVKVAMVDSGFFPHPFFAANGYNLIPKAAPGAGDPEQDDSGHGTGECANIFAVAPDCTVFGVKSGPSAATSLETAIALGPDVLSNSWGFDVDHRSRDALRTADPNFFNELLDIETILTDAVQNGIVVVFSAGNGHRSFPACMPQVIAAGGVTLLGDGALEASSYASSFESKLYPGRRVPDLCGLVGAFGPSPQKHHIMLPVPPESSLDGNNFPSKRKRTGWGVFSGTSASCPQLAGAVALLREIRQGATTDQIKPALLTTATDITTGSSALGDRAGAGPDLATGAGLANVLQACTSLTPVA
jgi:serine protease AprX